MMLLDVQDRIATITLNTPENYNALSPELLTKVDQALTDISHDKDIGVCVFTGAGAGFCAGADLSDGQVDLEDAALRAQTSGDAMRDLYNPLIKKLLNLPIPTVAAINGVAAGGGFGLALAFDLVIASTNASFKLVFTPQLGLIPDLGASWHAPQKLGRARAIPSAFFGESISATSAVEMGLIWKAVAHEELMGEAHRVAEILANGPTEAYVAVRKAFDHAGVSTLEQQLDYEAATQPELIASDNFFEGVMAFREKRKPNFRGD
ncbi:MAG: enoyl-CoA hydratase-related protein [Pseudomonadota bacterium]